MQKDAATLYKLIVLYMLYKVDFPLTNSQISEFILDQGYTNYFSLQTAINELIESDMIRVENIRNSSLYHLEAAGVEAIEMFEDRISDGIKQDIMTYFENNKYHLRNEVEITADYYPSKKEEYFVDSGYYKYHEAYHLLKFANEKQILEKAYNEYLDLKKSNLWGTHKYY